MIDDRRVERLRPGQNALGERFGFGDDPPEWPTGVGTAASVREWGLERPAIATACRPYMRMPRRRMFLTLRTEVASTSVLDAATLAAGRITGRLPHGVSAMDPLHPAGVAGLLFVLVLVATLVPARRATTVDPVRPLRTSSTGSAPGTRRAAA